MPLIQGLSQDSLFVLLWYGDTDTFVESAQALNLPRATMEFVDRVRERLTRSISPAPPLVR